MIKYFFIVLLSINLWSIDPMEINALRSEGVKIAIGDEELKIIPKNMRGKEFLNASGLDFNGMRLSFFLPVWIEEMRNLQELKLNNTNIDVDALKRIQGLRITDLNLNNNPNLFRNKGKIIPILSSLRLTTLSLKNTGANSSKLHALGTSARHLLKLDLSHNEIYNLENLFLQSSSISALNLAFNSMSSFSTNSLPRESLKKLNLSNNNIKKFDYHGDFPLLTSLNLSYNRNLSVDEKYQNNTLLSKLNKHHLLPKTLLSKFFTSKEELGSINENFTIQKRLKLKYPKLISLIMSTESMDDDERQYWFDILPSMSESQSNRLHTILSTEKEKLRELDKKYKQNYGNNNYSVIDNVDIPYGECALIVKSEKTISKVIDFIVNSNVDFNTNDLKVFLSKNGWYAVSLAFVEKSKSKNILSRLKRSGKIPDDSYCSTGNAYIKQVGLKF